MLDSALRPERPDALRRRIVTALQGGLPVTRHPYERIARDLGIEEQELLDALEQMLDEGLIRRVGVVPNHYALGYRYNLMVVWDIDDAAVDEVGARVGGLDFVSHCYRRPRLQGWPYNLFVMVHGKSSEEVERKIEQLRNCMDTGYRSHTALKSTKILKKTGLRIRSRES